MKIWIALVACLSFLPLSASADEPSLLGADDRVVSTDPKFSAVGRLNQNGTGFCTATLISAELIVTAAHCVFHPRSGRPFSPRSLHFIADWRNGEFRAHRRAAEVRIAQGFEFKAPRSGHRLRADLALIRLETRIPAHIITPIEIERDLRLLRLGVPLTQVSYSRDRPGTPLIERGCAVQDEDASVLMTDCDSYFGSSGAPVLEEHEDGLRLLAIQTAVYADGDIRLSASIRAREIETVRRTGVNPVLERRVSALNPR